MIILAYILSGLSLLMGILILIRLKATMPGILFWFPKLFAGGLSLCWAASGVVGAILGGVSGAYGAVPMGLFGACVSVWYVRRCSRDHNGFETAFGVDWQDRLSQNGTGKMLQSRWTWFLKMGGSPKPSFERDVVYCTVPGTQRELLCDLWQPYGGYPSGSAIIYLHGSGWTIGDKDMLTRPLFRYLTAQGHVVMDVSYRLFPEVDLLGMVGDVKRAVAWMKANASRLGVHPEKVFLAGSSAGGHLALLAGYTVENPDLIPDDLKNDDLSVCGVISWYGPVNLEAMYDRQVSNSPKIKDEVLEPVTPDTVLSPGDSGRVDILLGGRPEDILDKYQLFSPLYHVHPDCPPTLLFHGKQDILVPAEPTSILYKQLVVAGVPAMQVLFPQTDHGFDLMVPQTNPAAQSALYDVERFLALLANN